MFKCGLLVTTAFVVVGSLSFLAARASAQPVNAAPARDRNNEFLRTFGQFDVLSTVTAGLSSMSSYTIHKQTVAVPFIGHGRTVDHVRVREAIPPSSFHSLFEIGIYSNSPSGFPGKQLAASYGRAGTKFQRTSLPIGPITLKRKKTYWIVENIPPEEGSTHYVYWAADPKKNRKAYVQDYYFYINRANHSSSSYTSPWRPQSTGAYFRLQ